MSVASVIWNSYSQSALRNWVSETKIDWGLTVIGSDDSEMNVASDWQKCFERICVDNENSYNVLDSLSATSVRKWCSQVVFASGVRKWMCQKQDRSEVSEGSWEIRKFGSSDVRSVGNRNENEKWKMWRKFFKSESKTRLLKKVFRAEILYFFFENFLSFPFDEVKMENQKKTKEQPLVAFWSVFNKICEANY